MSVKTLDVPLPQPFNMLTLPPGSGNPPETVDFTKLRLLMLDIDGVVNSEKTRVATRDLPHPRFKKTDTKDFLAISSMESFDKHSITLVKMLCEVTGSLIVLSSSWRIGFNAEQVQRMLEAMGIPKELVLGRTSSSGELRGDQIKSFLIDIQGGPSSVREMIDEGLLLPEYSGLEDVKVESFAIIDDSTDMLEEQRPNFVHINAVEGFSLSDAIYTGRILSGDKDFGLRNFHPSVSLN